MRTTAIAVLVMLMGATAAFAQVPQYGNIPASATGYCYLNIEALLGSKLMHESGVQEISAKQADEQIGQHSELIFYTPRAVNPGAFVVLLRTSDTHVRSRLLAGRPQVAKVNWPLPVRHCAQAQLSSLIASRRFTIVPLDLAKS